MYNNNNVRPSPSEEDHDFKSLLSLGGVCTKMADEADLRIENFLAVGAWNVWFGPGWLSLFLSFSLLTL